MYDNLKKDANLKESKYFCNFCDLSITKGKTVNMNKKFLIEQCRRLDIIHQNESDELKQENEACNEWLIFHNEGHKKIISCFINFLESTEIRDKKVVKKWLKKQMKKSNEDIRVLDVKYSYFKNDEEMSKVDKKTYHMNDGANCIVQTLIYIIDGKRYISKLKHHL